MIIKLGTLLVLALAIIDFAASMVTPAMAPTAIHSQEN